MDETQSHSGRGRRFAGLDSDELTNEWTNVFKDSFGKQDSTRRSAIRIYGLWPIGTDAKSKDLRNPITASVAAVSADQAREIAAETARRQHFSDWEMWKDPSLVACTDVADATGVREGFAELHYTPGVGGTLPLKTAVEKSAPN